jgi:membrane complex biogenesis BtpA family protein
MHAAQTPGPLPPKALIGMVHVHALPGTPHAAHPIDEIAAIAAGEARILRDCGFDAFIVENMHDRPYVNAPHGPEIVAAMTRIGRDVRAAIGELPLGIQVLSRGEREALAVALAVGASFIRCENFVFAHVADEGVMTEAAAGPLLRYRRAIGADHIRIFADIQKKHASHAVTADLDLSEWAHGAEFFGADGVIVSGSATGTPTEESDVRAARSATRLPVMVGSGVTPVSAAPLLSHADALIVGSWIKRDGVWSNPIDPARCREMVAAVASARP